MACVDIVVPSARGIAHETQRSILNTLRYNQCQCGTHLPWDCNKGKHSLYTPETISGSIVHWSRNACVAEALYGSKPEGRPAPSHFLLIDDDMLFNPQWLSRMLRHKLDIVVGICTVRRDPPRPNIRYWRPELNAFVEPVEWDWDSQKVMEIDAAGMAFALVSRRVFERMGAAWLDCYFERLEDKRKGVDTNAYWDKKSALRKQRFEDGKKEKVGGKLDCWWFQLFDNWTDDQCCEYGEDVTFCVKAKALGFKIYADPQVLPGHLGWYGYGIEDWRAYIDGQRAANLLPKELPENKAQLEPIEVT